MLARSSGKQSARAAAATGVWEAGGGGPAKGRGARDRHGLEAARSRQRRRVAAAHWSTARPDGRGAWLVDNRHEMVRVVVCVFMSTVCGRSLGSVGSRVLRTPVSSMMEHVRGQSATLPRCHAAIVCRLPVVDRSAPRQARCRNVSQPARPPCLRPHQAATAATRGDLVGESVYKATGAARPLLAANAVAGGGEASGNWQGGGRSSRKALRPSLPVRWQKGLSMVGAPTCSGRLRSGAHKAMHPWTFSPPSTHFPLRSLIRILLRLPPLAM